MLKLFTPAINAKHKKKTIALLMNLALGTSLGTSLITKNWAKGAPPLTSRLLTHMAPTQAQEKPMNLRLLPARKVIPMGEGSSAARLQKRLLAFLGKSWGAFRDFEGALTDNFTNALVKKFPALDKVRGYFPLLRWSCGAALFFLMYKGGAALYRQAKKAHVRGDEFKDPFEGSEDSSQLDQSLRNQEGYDAEEKREPKRLFNEVNIEVQAKENGDRGDLSVFRAPHENQGKGSKVGAMPYKVDIGAQEEEIGHGESSLVQNHEHHAKEGRIFDEASDLERAEEEKQRRRVEMMKRYCMLPKINFEEQQRKEEYPPRQNGVACPVFKDFVRNIAEMWANRAWQAKDKKFRKDNDENDFKYDFQYNFAFKSCDFMNFLESVWDEDFDVFWGNISRDVEALLPKGQKIDFDAAYKASIGILDRILGKDFDGIWPKVWNGVWERDFGESIFDLNTFDSPQELEGEYKNLLGGMALWAIKQLPKILSKKDVKSPIEAYVKMCAEEKSGFLMNLALGVFNGIKIFVGSLGGLAIPLRDLALKNKAFSDKVGLEKLGPTKIDRANNSVEHYEDYFEYYDYCKENIIGILKILQKVFLPLETSSGLFNRNEPIHENIRQIIDLLKILRPVLPVFVWKNLERGIVIYNRAPHAGFQDVFDNNKNQIFDALFRPMVLFPWNKSMISALRTSGETRRKFVGSVLTRFCWTSSESEERISERKLADGPPLLARTLWFSGHGGRRGPNAPGLTLKNLRDNMLKNLK